MKLFTWLINISAIYKGHRVATTLLRSSGGPSSPRCWYVWGCFFLWWG